MRIYIEYGDKRQGFAFPMSPIRIQDVLDRMNIQNSTEIKFRFSSYDSEKLFGTEKNRWYSADIYKLNMFVERYEVELEYSEQAALKSVIMKHPDSNIDDMLLMTYGVDSVLTFPCYSHEELGKIAVKNRMVRSLKDLPHEYLKYIDYAKVGAEFIEQGNGIIIDDYFCMPQNYRRPDIDIEIAPSKKEFFRLLVAPSAHDMDKAQWVYLPRDEQVLYDMAKDCGLPTESLYFAEIESALPTFNKGSYVDEGWLDDIIEISKELAKLPHHKFVKAKAIMVMNNAEVTGEVFDAISTLNEYDFDPMVQDESQFGKAYACRVFPTNFDWSVMKDCDMHDFGQAVLRRKQGMMTEYGAFSGQGQKLYTTLTPKQEQNEDEVEDEDMSEDDEIQIGVNFDFDKEIDNLKTSLIAGIIGITDDLKRTLSDPNCDGETIRTAPLRIRKGSSDFKGEKPVSVKPPDGCEVNVKSWKQTVEVLLRDCFKSPEDQEWLRSQCGRVSGRSRVLLTDDSSLLQKPVEICDNVFFETRQDVPTMFDILIERLFRPMGYDYRNVAVNVKFDAPVLYHEQVQETDEEDVSEDISEDDNIQMGGMSQ